MEDPTLQNPTSPSDRSGPFQAQKPAKIREREKSYLFQDLTSLTTASQSSRKHPFEFKQLDYQVRFNTTPQNETSFSENGSAGAERASSVPFRRRIAGCLPLQYLTVLGHLMDTQTLPKK